MQRSFKFLMMVYVIFLSACAVGPDYVRPKAKVAAQFKEAKGKMVMDAKTSSDWKVAEPADDINRGEWWKIFHDQKLNELEARLNAENQSIINAEANYRQAQALVDEARASFFPTLSLSAALTRQKQSGGSTFFNSTTNGVPTSGAATTSNSRGSSKKITTTHSLLLNATWEPDIWGLVRRTVEAAAGGAEASAALVAVTRLSSQATLAQTYFELRGLDSDQKLLDATVRKYKASLALTRHQYASGVASRADIVQAQSLLEAAEAAAINNGVARAQYEHAIAVLIGVPAGDFSLAYKPLPPSSSPPPIPLVVPSSLLERRPDIAQAERLMMQANAQIGVAVAAYFPTLTLSGSLSDVGRGASHWFSMPNLGWAYGPQLAEIIFDGGLRAATLRAANAGYDAAVANYRQVVLSAFQDVEDNLAALRILSNEYVVQKQAVASASLALKLVINQYKSGTVDYASVITAQINAYTAEKNAVDVNYLRMTAAVGLIKALGGGWNVSKICRS